MKRLLLLSLLVACDAADPVTAPSTGSFATPEGVVGAGDLIVVANPDFRGEGFGAGTVTVIDGTTRRVVNRAPTTAPNPQFLATTDTAVVVVCSGETLWDAGATVHAAVGPGGVDVFPRDGLRTATGPATHIALPVDPGDPRHGGPGSIAVLPDGHTAYIGSGLSAIVVKVDLASGEVLRGMADPIVLRDHERNDTVTLAWHPSGVVLAATFDTDLLFRIDPNTDTLVGDPVDLGANSDLEGVVDLTVAPGSSPDVLWVMTIASAVGAWDLAGGAAQPRAATAGVAANRIRVGGGYAYVVNSGENNVQRSPLATLGDVARPFAALPVGSNPWDLAIVGDVAYVTLFRANRVAVVDLATGALLEEIE